MYIVAAHVIATYSGQSYTSFVEERIFTPLGMTSSTYSPTKAEASGKLTAGWTKEGRRVPARFTEDMALAIIAGPGGVISNAVDMVSLYKRLLTCIDLPCFRPGGFRHGLVKVSTTIRLSYRCLYTRTYHTLTLFPLTTRSVWDTRSSDMAWVGSVVHIADTT